MIRDYIEAALQRAHYELIEDEEPFYGEVPELQGVWATGKTLEECRQKLAEVVDGWVLIRLARTAWKKPTSSRIASASSRGTASAKASDSSRTAFRSRSLPPSCARMCSCAGGSRDRRCAAVPLANPE